MEEDNNNRRLLTAAALCFIVLIGWNFVFPPPKRPPAAKATQAGAQTATVAQLPGTATTTSTAAGAPGTARIAPTKAEEPVHFEFSGRVPGAVESEAIPYHVIFTNVGGGIDHFELPSYKERDRDNRKTDQNITLARSVEKDGSLFGQMAGIEFIDGTTFKMPPVPIYTVAEGGSNHLSYRFVTEDGIEIEREYHLNPESFQIELAVTVRNHSKSPQSHRLQIGSASVVSPAMEAGSGILSTFIPPPDHLAAICHAQGSVERQAHAALIKNGPKIYSGAVKWAAIDRQYFLSAIIPRDGTEVDCNLSAHDRYARSALALPLVTLKPGDERRHKFTAYLGVKKPSQLTLMNADVEEAIDYTILGLNLSAVCAALLWILRLFHGWFNSWGLAILGLTVLVKLMLFPLNQRSGRSMRAMSALKPQIDALRLRFPDDKQRQSEEMLKLYKVHNVNPAGGCLPILIQMPIWFALYRSLWVSVDLFQQPFLWIPDLTARDPMWVLPVVLVVVMIIQQRMTPSTMDPAQQKIMQWTMPLMFGAMMMALPAGLCFYILVNTLLTIVQMHLINKSIGPIGGSPSVQGATA